MAIKLIRVKSGEDIVGDIVGENEENLTIENPAIIMQLADGRSNKVNVGLVPWSPFSHESKVKVDRDWVVFVTTPVKDILNNYNQIFGSGIVVPDVRVDAKTLLTG